MTNLKLRDSVLKRDEFTCQNCDLHTTDDKLEVHHVIPRKRGGANSMVNSITLCGQCHPVLEKISDKVYGELDIIGGTSWGRLKQQEITMNVRDVIGRISRCICTIKYEVMIIYKI